MIIQKGPAERVIGEAGKELDDLARKVIGAGIEVHRILGPGHLEQAYEDAL